MLSMYIGEVWMRYEHGALVEQYGRWQTNVFEDESVSVCAL